MTLETDSVISSDIAKVSEAMERTKHLYQPTAANLASMKELETRKHLIKDSEDPWWEKRTPKFNHKPKNSDVMDSSEFDDRRSQRSRSASRTRELDLEGSLFEEKRRGTVPISDNNRLLAPTRATRNSALEAAKICSKDKKTSPKTIAASDTMSVKSDSDRKSVAKALWSGGQSEMVQQLAGTKQKFKDIQSKLHKATVASTSGVWKKPVPVDAFTFDNLDSKSVSDNKSEKSFVVKEAPSRLFRTTAATVNGQWKKDEIQLSAEGGNIKTSNSRESSGRLLRPTTATINGQWKKEHSTSTITTSTPSHQHSASLTSDASAYSNAKIQEANSRLTRPTTATINAKWSKEITDEKPNIVVRSTPRRASTDAALPSGVPVTSDYHKVASRLTQSTAASTSSQWKKDVDSSASLRSKSSKTPERRRPSSRTEFTEEEAQQLVVTPSQHKAFINGVKSRLMKPTTAYLSGMYGKEITRPTSAKKSIERPKSAGARLGDTNINDLLQELSGPETSEYVEEDEDD